MFAVRKSTFVEVQSETVGCVMYLCLRNTMPDTRCSLVSSIHRAIDIVKKICLMSGDDFELHNYERFRYVHFGRSLLPIATPILLSSDITFAPKYV